MAGIVLEREVRGGLGMVILVAVFSVAAAIVIGFVMAPHFMQGPGPVRLGSRARWQLAGWLLGAWVMFFALVAVIPDLG